MSPLDLFPVIAFAIAAPAAFAPLCLVAGRRNRSKTAWLALIGAALSLGALGLAALEAPAGGLLASRPWVPSLGLDLAFRLDGLSLFFALVVSGMGCLVLWYSRHYMDDHAKDHGRFYAFMLLFMSAMLGTVLSDDLLLTFVFWELTGITSFLLIGFNAGDNLESALGARRALLVTLGTGLGLLAGVLLLRLDLGSTRISELLAQPGAVLAAPHAALILALLLLGAFGKSAQAPFQFWLPGAMAAPTPVSAYLHSATLVKLGIFLAARLYPLFHGHALWAPLLIGVGGVTLLLGAAYALFSHDLKAVLAYTTVAQLGALLFWYGIAPLAAVPAAEALGLFHILSHVLYKGSLFMQAGIVDHVAGTRDLRQLGGLSKHLPLTFAAGLLACASLAGLPGSFGFVSKEVYLEALLHLSSGGQLWAWAALAAFVLAAVMLVAVALRLALKPYLGELPEALRGGHLHHAALGFQAPPLLLALAVPVLGLLPMLAWRPLASLGGADASAHPLHALHLGPAFAVSAAVLGLGYGLYRLLYQRRSEQLSLAKGFDWGHAFDASLYLLVKAAKKVSSVIRVDQPEDYLSIVIGACTLLLGTALWVLLPFWPQGPVVMPTLMEGLILALMAGAGLGVVFLEKWTTRLLSLGIVGFLVCFYFMLNRAPDLALTQMLIESATLILLLLLLGRFPQDAEIHEKKDRGRSPRKALAAIISTGLSLVVFTLMLNITAKPHPRPMGPDFLSQTLPLALGSNAVNTVLVDFRGFDTMFEITVLAIAALGCLGLLMRWKEKGAPEYTRPKPLLVVEPTSFILKTSVRVLFVALNILAAYLTLKGHNEPGGGFIGGLVSALSLVLVSMVLGVESARRLLRIDPFKLTLFGLLLAYGSSLGPVFFGKAFMQHAAMHLTLPGFGDLHLLTAQIFDFGVYFVVVGVTAKMMFTFALSVQLKEPFEPEELDRYATSAEEPIEDAAWASDAPGLAKDAPLKPVGHLGSGRGWRKVG